MIDFTAATTPSITAPSSYSVRKFKIPRSAASGNIGDPLMPFGGHALSDLPTFCNLQPRHSNPLQGSSRDFWIDGFPRTRRSHLANCADNFHRLPSFLQHRKCHPQDQRADCSLNDLIHLTADTKTKALSLSTSCMIHVFVHSIH